MLEHLFPVGWVTRIAVKPRKISIYRTFTVSGIFLSDDAEKALKPRLNKDFIELGTNCTKIE